MGTFVIVYLALLSIFLNVGAEDTADAEITLKSGRYGTITYGILDTEGSVLEACSLERVDKEVYQLYPVSNVTTLNIFYAKLNNFKCAFEIRDVNVSYSGKWKLKATYLDDNGPSTLESKPINIILEDEVNMLPEKSITVYQGDTLYIRFSETTANIQRCEVWTGSSESEQTEVSQREDMAVDTNCSITFSDVQPDVNGIWTFKAHGDVLILWGQLNISVIAIPRVDTTTINLQLGSSAILKFGPDDATHCKATDPTGLVHVMQIGQCNLRLPVTTPGHHGEWKVQATLPGKMTSDIYSYTVNIEQSDRAQINPYTAVPSVVMSDDKKIVKIKCSLMVPSINGCWLVRSDGRDFSALQWNVATLSEGQYSHFGMETYNDTNGNIINECGLQIQQPELVDLQPWQCIMSLDNGRQVGTYIDILKWDDPILADFSNNTDLDLGKQKTVNQMLGKSFEVKCSLPRKLDYCWFRTPNIKQLVPIPGVSNPAYEYVGRGLGIGECGIRIRNATGADTGTWSCNMGSYTDRDMKKATHVVIYRSGVHGSFQFRYPNAVLLTCTTLDYSALDYCRFVRPDGVGINPMHTNGLSYDGNETQLSRGTCKLHIPDMAYEDFGTWTCAGKPTTSAEEYQDTMNLYGYVYFASRKSSWLPWTLYFTLTACMAIMMVSIVQRTKMGILLKQRTRNFRQSYRNKENEYKSPKQIEAESQI